MELEKHYNVKLFERFSRKLYITEDGRELLYYAKHLVKSFDDLENMMEKRGKNKYISEIINKFIEVCVNM